MSDKIKKQKKKPISKVVQHSKAISFLLRHGAIKEGLKIRKDGYVLIDDLLSMKKFQNLKFEDIQELVQDNDKQRFKIIKEDGKMYIRANQGHSMEGIEISMEEITTDTKIDVCVHGTYYEALKNISKEGLCKMKRQHIHFAIGLPGESGVISGMRKTCEVLIYLDLDKALKDGIKFYKSENGVILSPGVGEKGLIDPKYFLKVIDVETMEEIKE
eukprot:gene3220-5535_t